MHYPIIALMHGSERPKGVKDVIKQARRAAALDSSLPYYPYCILHIGIGMDHNLTPVSQSKRRNQDPSPIGLPTTLFGILVLAWIILC
jgi:hypothetical protein